MGSLGYMGLCLKTKQIESKTSRQKVNEKNGGCLGPHSLGMIINLMVEAIQEIECRAIFEQTGGHGKRKVFIAQTEVYVLILCF